MGFIDIRQFVFGPVKHQMSDEIGLADDASDRPVLFADDNKPDMRTGKSNGCIPQCRVSTITARRVLVTAAKSIGISAEGALKWAASL